MLCGIKEILIIVTSRDLGRFKNLLGNGELIGMNINYAIQDVPNGLAEAFILGKQFIGNDSCCLILGDNIFYGQGFREILEQCINLHPNNGGAITFAYSVTNPSSFGVVEFDKDFNAISIEEKPQHPKSDFALTGLYFYDNSVIKIASNLAPSPRGELEITDINLAYLARKKLKVKVLGRGFAWLDTGNAESLAEASDFIATIQRRTNYKIACIEEIAFNNGWID